MEFLSSVHWKEGHGEKDSGNRTTIKERGISDELRQEGEK